MMFGWSGWHDKHLNRGLDSFSIMTVTVGNRDRLHCTVQYIMSLSSHWMVGVEGLLAFVFGRHGIKKKRIIIASHVFCFVVISQAIGAVNIRPSLGHCVVEQSLTSICVYTGVHCVWILLTTS